MKKKPKQIAAIICIILLVLLYIATLVVSLLDFPGSDRLFAACLQPLGFPSFCGSISGFMANIPASLLWQILPTLYQKRMPATDRPLRACPYSDKHCPASRTSLLPNAVSLCKTAFVIKRICIKILDQTGSIPERISSSSFFVCSSEWNTIPFIPSLTAASAFFSVSSINTHSSGFRLYLLQRS